MAETVYAAFVYGGEFTVFTDLHAQKKEHLSGALEYW